MELYHGSYIVINQPRADVGRRNLDFGRGFYLTSIREQAEQWAKVVTERKTRGGTPHLNVYDFDFEQIPPITNKHKVFDSYNLEWLEYVVGCRQGENIWQQYDIVEGGVANDNVIDTVEDYQMGFISAEQALGQLRNKKVNHQICIINQLVIDKCLRFKESVALQLDNDAL